MAIAWMPPSAWTRRRISSSSSVMQSQRTLPASLRTSRARWPIAKLGSQPMPRMPASSRISALWPSRSSRHDSQTCPSSCGMYCRGSSQIAHAPGGSSLGGYCVPQALHTQVVATRVRLMTTMRVTFVKSAARRYGVLVERELAHDVAIDPAPGYHDHLPHDLLHFVAEAEWKLDGAVFGQLASGGDAGIFIPVDQSLVARAMRDRKRAKRAAGKPRGRRSELLTDILENAWAVRRGVAALPTDWGDRLAAARVSPGRL